ncbi:DMT family transporter [Maritimibacter sp. DP1N21-5]|uniref:DMT family transporter n=1 Tax=Maritimibacter sp. DP1N21-5 TaxID=2836867 RepID=UPI001C493D6F|nr:DMT family transporter [Maritimibacter sp. DP1N21-5]MBV7410380.1 DMT family transporter [Maritimibacter sp. DP1N21-5]
MDRQITAKSWVLLLVLGLVWGSTFLIIEIALGGVGPFWLAASRVIFAALLMTVVWTLRGFRLFASPASGRDWLNLVFVALSSSTFPFMLLAWGQQSVTSAFAGVTMATVIFIVLPLAHFTIPGERMRLRSTVGFVVGFAGVVLLIGGQVFTSTGAEHEFAGRLAALGTAAFYAVGSVQMRRLPTCDPIGLAAVLMIIGAVAMVPIVLLVEGPPPLPAPAILGSLVFLGLVPTAAANFIRVYLIRTVGPTFMGLVNYIVPVVSTLLGALVLSEPLPATLLAALTVILAGMAISQWEALARLGRRLLSRETAS